MQKIAGKFLNKYFNFSDYKKFYSTILDNCIFFKF